MAAKRSISNDKMAAKSSISKFLIGFVTLVVLSFIDVANGEQADELCVNGFYSEAASCPKRSTLNITEVTAAIRRGVRSCKQAIWNGDLPLDPVDLNGLEYSVSKSGHFVKVNFSHVQLSGLSSMVFRPRTVKVSDGYLGFRIRFREWRVIGRYDLTARFAGQGPIPILGVSSFTFGTAESWLIVNCSLLSHPNGTLYVEDLTSSLKFKELVPDFHELNIGGSNWPFVEKFLDELVRRVIKRASPKLLETLNNVLEPCLNSKLVMVSITQDSMPVTNATEAMVNNTEDLTLMTDAVEARAEDLTPVANATEAMVNNTEDLTLMTDAMEARAEDLTPVANATEAMVNNTEDLTLMTDAAEARAEDLTPVTNTMEAMVNNTEGFRLVINVTLVRPDNTEDLVSVTSSEKL